MNREMFIARLRDLLVDVTDAEREEAISYYEEYFEDAGVENEQSVIESLGSPEKVAATIKRGLHENAGEEGEFTENGYTDNYYESRDEVVARAVNGKSQGFGRFKNISSGGWIIILILCIFALPILGPLLIGIGSALIGIFAAVVAVIFAVGVVGVALIIAALAMIVSGFIAVFTTPIVGIALIGAALFVGGLGILIAILGFWIIVKVIPPFIKGCINFCGRLFRRKEV